MDFVMPEMSEPKATNLIRQYLYEQSIEQPIIAGVTGHSEQKYKDKAI